MGPLPKFPMHLKLYVKKIGTFKFVLLLSLLIKCIKEKFVVEKSNIFLTAISS